MGNGKFEEAVKVFDEMPERSSSYMALAASSSRAEKGGKRDQNLLIKQIEKTSARLRSRRNCLSLNFRRKSCKAKRSLKGYKMRQKKRTSVLFKFMSKQFPEPDNLHSAFWPLRSGVTRFCG
ncbi:uncharacterized protein LOC141672077 isoform X1 [Apium graveolens]|uniref:uncharacterized protein LOC141672077 isoform X1 n=1 Tax=Apium graveolens TaxID=4045 RepID=UPI003D793461